MDTYLNYLKGTANTAAKAVSPVYNAVSTAYSALKKKPATSNQTVTASSPSAVGPTTTVKASTTPAASVSPAIKTPAAQSYIQSQMPTQPTTTAGFTKPVYAQNPNQNADGTPIVQASQKPSVASQNAPQTPSARDSYIQAYKAYQDAQTKTQEVSKARQAYNDFMANQAKSIAGKEGRGLGIPLEIVRGEQERLLKQTQPEAQRLQGEVGIAQSEQENLVNAAKSGLDMQKDLLGIDIEEKKAQREALKPIVVDGVAYAQQADGSLKPLTAKQQEAFNLSEGQTRYEIDPQTGQYRAIASKAKSYSPNGTTGGLTPYQQFQATQSISKDNAARTANAREISRQTSLMNQAYSSFVSGGDKNVSTQAIISTFNKILDPTSVVRESEYDRTAQGQALLSRIQGKYENIAQGGAGVTPETLKAAVDLANEYLQNAQESLVQENKRSQAIASQFGINPEFVTSGNVGQVPQEPTNEFADVEQYITPDPATKTAYIPRAVWSTLGNRMDALLADIANDGYTLKIKD